MREIPLGRSGKRALVGDDDYERLSVHLWVARWSRHSNTYYACRRIKDERGLWRKTVHMHREIVQCPDDMVVDHINHNGLDNRRENLRVCTTRENRRNTQSRRRSSSRFKGVSWKKDRGRWRAYIAAGPVYETGPYKGWARHIQLGYFDSEEDAARAYNEAALRWFGRFARLNEVAT